MAFFYDDLYEMPTRRHTFAGDPAINRSSRTWSNNGVHYTFQTASFGSPNFASGMTGDRSQPQPQPRSQGSGLIGTAFNLLGSVLAARQAKAANRGTRRTARSQTQADDLAYGEDYSDGQPRTLFSNFPRRSSPESQPPRRGSSGREQSPRRRRRHGGEARRSRSYRADQYESSQKDRSAYVEDESTDEDSDESFSSQEMPHQQQPRRAFMQDDDSLIEALENAQRHHRREAHKCRDRIQQLSQQPMASTRMLQNLLDELKRHESAFENARENLKLLQNNRRRGSQPNQQSNGRRGTFNPETDRSGQFPRDPFASFFANNSRPPHPLFGEGHPLDDFGAFPGMPFGAFEAFFNDFGPRMAFGGGMPHFFTMPGATFGTGPRPQARAGSQSGGQFQSQRGFSFNPPKPSPPANLLNPEEAKRLFKTYNERWNSLGPTDPNIPYPSRKLHPNGLLARDSIWAPAVSCSVTEWSEEVVMQANAQAFYLGAVGLSPQYTEAGGTGKISMGYNKAKSTPAQVKELTDLLKKEKGRWHSDRLGRRNGPGGGTNESLQRDEKARAVFHAVCELMEAAQGP